MSCSPEREAELAELKALPELTRPDILLESAFTHMVRLQINHSRLVRLVVVLNMTSRYWTEDAVAVQLSSPTLPQPLLAKLEQACDKEARAHAGEPQLIAVVRFVLNFLEMNRLVPAWEELKLARELLLTPPPHADPDAFTASNWIRLHEKSGRVTIRAQQAAYWMEFELTIPVGYPDSPPIVKVVGTNLHDRLRDICVANASEIARRMHAGFSADAALAHQGPPGRAEKRDAPPDLSAGGLQQLKHDREFLHSVAQVRGYEERKARRFVEHAERKNMEQQAAEKAKQEALLAGSAAAEGDQRLPLPSVLAIVKYVVQRTVRELPTQLCPICGVAVLPADPSSLHEALDPKAAGGQGQSSKLKQIERVFCGHWFHSACLEARLTVPPFRLDCAAPGCGKEVYHPKYSERIDKLEKRWANEQAKKREIEELAGLMNME